MKESTRLRATRMFYVGSFLISSVLLIGFSLTRPTRPHFIAAYLWLIALVLGAVIIGACKGRRHGLMRLFLFVAVLNLILVPPELYLRLKDFRFESGIQFGYPRPYQLAGFEPDRQLFWKYPHSGPGVNSYAFEGPEVTTPKPAGTYRIVFLGNSCTHQGFPAMVELILHAAHNEVECLSFATPGYTTYQGKVFAETYLAGLEPDLLVVSYGWDDRWLAYGAQDEDKKMAADHGVAASAFEGLYSNWRLLQYFRKALSPVLGRNEPLEISRVPIDQFKNNLEEIGSAAGKLGCPVIFATEPSSHPAVGVPACFVESKFAKSKESSLALFKEYNNAVRDVSREGSSRRLIDLDSLMSSRVDVRQLFTGDGIGYSKAGLAVVADIEARYILDHFLASHEAKH